MIPSATARPFALGVLVVGTLALAACSKDQDLYPSLSIRAEERVTGVFDPVAPEPYAPTPAGPETLSRLAALQAEAEGAHKAFLAAAGNARAPVSAARGAEMGSEAWSIAEVALADAIAARSATMMPLAELDLIHADTLEAEGDVAEVEKVREKVEALLAEEDRQVEQLNTQLSH